MRPIVSNKGSAFGRKITVSKNFSTLFLAEDCALCFKPGTTEWVTLSCPCTVHARWNMHMSCLHMFNAESTCSYVILIHIHTQPQTLLMQTQRERRTQRVQIAGRKLVRTGAMRYWCMYMQASRKSQNLADRLHFSCKRRSPYLSALSPMHTYRFWGALSLNVTASQKSERLHRGRQ